MMIHVDGLGIEFTLLFLVCTLSSIAILNTSLILRSIIRITIAILI